MKIEKLGGILLVIGMFVVLIGVGSLRGLLGYIGGLIILLGAGMVWIGIHLVKEKKVVI
ncbi:MAG TPA: hypothetical protein VNB67_01645 [Nitrososphaeraceae archaeon]|jgi:hypothetical protein|nr:hypothetical protein [Nitrososphaeraceae archaeon]